MRVCAKKRKADWILLIKNWVFSRALFESFYTSWIYTQTSIMDFSLNVCYYWLLIFTFMTSQASFYLLFGPTRKFNNLVNNPVQNGGVFQFSLYPDLDLFFYQNTSYYRLKRVRFSRTANSWTPKAKLIRLIEIFLDTWLIYHSSYKPL